MPIRVRARLGPERDPSPVPARHDYDLPSISPDDPFRLVVKKLALYVAALFWQGLHLSMSYYYGLSLTP